MSVAAIAVALAATAAPAASAMTPPEPHTVTHRILAIVGDSYASGEGAGQYDPRSGRCHRSRNAAGVLAAHEVSMTPVLLACSGNTTADVPGQLRGVPAQTAVVYVSIGGNDMGFGDVGTACFDPRRDDCLTQVGAAMRRLTAVQRAVAHALLLVHHKAPHAAVVLGRYPRIITKNDSPLSCLNRGIGVTGNELSALRVLEGGLFDAQTGAMAAARRSAGGRWLYQSLASDFYTHDICSASPWEVTPAAANQLFAGYAAQELAHPNPAGQRALAQALADVIGQYHL